MKNNYRTTRTGSVQALLLVVLALSVAGCGANAQKGAAQGATTGAVAGAVGGMFTALVFGGNVAEAGARGAVYGGSSGAAVGAMAGSSVDRAEAQQKQAQLEAERQAQLKALRDKIGPDAYNGLVALAECKHDIAIANAREAAKSGKKDFALAGTWVEVLTEADRQQDAQAQALFPELVKRDSQVKTDAEVQVLLDKMLNNLHQIRAEYAMPSVCRS